MALTNREKVRLNIGDTEAIGFSPDEIDNFLSVNSGNVLLASADACRSLAAQAAQLSTAEVYGVREQDRRGMAKNFLAMADNFQSRADSQPAFGVIEIALTDFSASEILALDSIRNN